MKRVSKKAKIELEKEALIDEILFLYSEKLYDPADISKELGIPIRTVENVIDKAANKGRIEKRSNWSFIVVIIIIVLIIYAISHC